MYMYHRPPGVWILEDRLIKQKSAVHGALESASHNTKNRSFHPLHTSMYLDWETVYLLRQGSSGVEANRWLLLVQSPGQSWQEALQERYRS